MKILLIGCPPEIKVLLETLLGSNDCKITHCADDTRAIAELHRDMDARNWALGEAPMTAGGEKDVAGAIRAMGSQTSADIATAGSTSSCGVEWSRDGILQLHCRLHSALHENALARHVAPRSIEGYVFKYHAPCGKERKRHE